MYIGEISGWGAAPDATTSYTQSTADQCRARGGIYTPSPIGMAGGGTCTVPNAQPTYTPPSPPPPPPPPPPAPINVSVASSPTVQTAISPQISPIFQQQFQPSNSPLSAGTAQTSPTTQAGGAYTPPDTSALQNFMQLQAQRDQQQADMLRQMIAERQQQSEPQIPQLPPITEEPMPMLPVPKVENVPDQNIDSHQGIDNKWLIIGGVAAIAVLAYVMRKKGKGHASR